MAASVAVGRGEGCLPRGASCRERCSTATPDPIPAPGPRRHGRGRSPSQAPSVDNSDGGSPARRGRPSSVSRMPGTSARGASRSNEPPANDSLLGRVDAYLLDSDNGGAHLSVVGGLFGLKKTLFKMCYQVDDVSHRDAFVHSPP
eukprot:3153366-Pyramimonas_sp.AAC.1